MAISVLATANTTIGPAQYADMAQALAPRFLVDTPGDLRPAWQGNRVTVQPGAATIAGTRVHVSGVESVDIAAPPSGERVHAVVLRVRWDSGPNGASLKVITSAGDPEFSYHGFEENKMNRIPGVCYDALICLVRRSAHTATVYDYRCWGGDGGPIRTSLAAVGVPGWLDMRRGSMISADRGAETRRLDDDGVWRSVLTDDNPWRTWNPTLRFYKGEIPNGVNGGHVGNLGNGAFTIARYRVVDGLLQGYVNIEMGATGVMIGAGQITIDLPLPAANWIGSSWSMGHLYTYPGFGQDWPAQLLVKAGWTRGTVFSSRGQDDSRLFPYRISEWDPRTNSGDRPGTGMPFIEGSWPHGTLTFNLLYPVA